MPLDITAPASAHPAEAAVGVVETLAEPDVQGVDGAVVVDVVELSARLRLSTTRLARRLRREAEVDLSPTMLSAMTSIILHGPLTLGALAEFEGVAPPTITKVVTKLVDRGLVARTSDPSDGRVCHVACTPEGLALGEESRQRKNAWLAARLGEFDPAERERLAAAIDVLEALASGGHT